MGKLFILITQLKVSSKREDQPTPTQYYILKKKHYQSVLPGTSQHYMYAIR